MSKNLSELSGRKGLTDNLFDRMGQLAQTDGTPSTEELQKLADEFLIGDATTYGTATFYDFLKPENKGKKAYVCNGTACVCAGTQEKVIEDLKKHYSADEIGHMTCLGRCHENSAFHISGQNYSGTALNELGSIIEKKTGAQDSYTIKALQKSILTEEFTTIDQYYASFKAILKKDSNAALDEIKLSNVRGRGGAGFPMGIKLGFCRNAESETKFIICNADEGDPGAYSDRYLLEQRPHSVLYGMLVAGYVTHANWGVVYIRAEYPDSARIIQEEIYKLRTAGLIGENIDGSGFNFDFKIIRAQGSYICGEETALINSIEGQRPEVRIRPLTLRRKDFLINQPSLTMWKLWLVYISLLKMEERPGKRLEQRSPQELNWSVWIVSLTILGYTKWKWERLFQPLSMI
jgi:NADH:ubiquinone oxidoreductase subunit E